MIRSAITVCLVPEASGGPFVFHGDLSDACREAEALGFDAIEIFAPSGDHVNTQDLSMLLERHSLRLAAVGTGAGMVLQGLTLCDGGESGRERACRFVKGIIDLGAPFGAPAIVGSMQGRAGGTQDKRAALGHLADSLRKLARYAADHGQKLMFEPLNRYETDLVNTLADGAALLDTVEADNLKLLADLFHMNIEETSIAGAIREAQGRIGHVHFVDSNRRAAGLGHMPYEPIAEALMASGYQGYASAEAFPLPDAEVAASMTMQSFRRFMAR
jgi:sugar phosphate isomerase/epimerase